MTIKSLRATLEDRIRILEDTNGWDRMLGWAQCSDPKRPGTEPGAEMMYEFGRFAQLVDLLEELS